MARFGSGLVTILDVLDGNRGVRGTTHTYAINNGWSDALADFTASASGGSKIVWDVVTISYTATGFSQTKYWDGSVWSVVAQVLDGSLLVKGSINVGDLDANGTISGARLETAAWNDTSVDRTVMDNDTFVHYTKGSTIPAVIIGQEGNIATPIMRIGNVSNPVRGLDVYSGVNGMHANVILNTGSGTALNVSSGSGTGTALVVETLNSSATSPTVTINSRGSATGLYISGLSSAAPLKVEQLNQLAPAINLITNASQPPMTVNSSVMVAKLNADYLDGYHASNFSKFAKTSSMGSSANTTTAQFLAALGSRITTSGATFSKNAWSYAGYGSINDTGCGVIDLAGATVEVFTHGTSNYLIRITSASSQGTSGAIAHSTWEYRNHGAAYSPAWVRIYNTRNKPTLNELSGTAGTATTAASCTGNATTSTWADTVDVNTSTSTGHYHMNWHSGDTMFSCSSGAGAYYRPSDGFTQFKHGYLAGGYLQHDTSGRLIARHNGRRDAGMYGLYNSAKISHMWSMGTAYKVHAAGTNFGNLYGMAYKHTNNTSGGTMAGGHQLVVCQNGVTGVALGMAGNIWAKGNIQAKGNLTAYLTSDFRVKRRLEEYKDPLGDVMQWRTGTYEKQDGQNKSKWVLEDGFIAQDIEKSFIDLVQEADDVFRTKRIRTGGYEISAKLAGAIKQLKREHDSAIDGLRAEIRGMHS